ncbi:GNAT family N-acetyltransferase [Ensifer adhaerens]|uniref:GNAT family N-acetyltransferase n=1 Tax=Ensifer adhaerens TaxID=106592 RepID=UPI003D070CEE
MLEIQLRRHFDNPAGGIAYPRCETADELIAEFKLYGLNWRRGLRILETTWGSPVAAFGFLYSPEDLARGTMIERSDGAVAYSLGPYCFDEDTAVAVECVLAWMERLAARRFGALRLCVSAENRALRETVLRRGWAEEEQSLEMVWVAADNQPPSGARGIWTVLRLTDRDDLRLPQLAVLLADHFQWSDDRTDRLTEHLAEGYRIGYVFAEGAVLGACVWLKVAGTDFGRLEYLAVTPEARRRHIGTSLVHVALEDLRSAGCKQVFLSMDPSATAARAVYTAHGFVSTLQYSTFELSF